MISFLILALAVQSYLGFDRNIYPGDAQMTALKRDFSFTGYWLSLPPGERSNTWSGKRQFLNSTGYGFLLLFNGRLEAKLGGARLAAQLGKADGASAVIAAEREGFPSGAVIFLDQEEGGRMTAPQRAYIHAWVDAVNQTGYRAGIYCSGIPADEGRGVKVITAVDIKQNAGGRAIVYWVTNDACPPSGGCVTESRAPSVSGVPFAAVWQFAQSPRRKQVTHRCAGYSDGECYINAVERRLDVDLDSSILADPSDARTK